MQKHNKVFNNKVMCVVQRVRGLKHDRKYFKLMISNVFTQIKFFHVIMAYTLTFQVNT